MAPLGPRTSSLPTSAKSIFSSKTDSDPPTSSSSSSSSAVSRRNKVIRSLPLGSLIAPLGDVKRDDHRPTPKKLNEKAKKHDEEAASIVAGIFAASGAAAALGTAPLYQASLTQSSSSGGANSSDSRPRLSLFGRKAYGSPSSSTTQLAPVSGVPLVNYTPPTPAVERPSASAASNGARSGDEDDHDDGRGRSSQRVQTRSMSPFFRSARSRSRARSPSPDNVGALRGSRSEAADSDSDGEDTGTSTAGEAHADGQTFEDGLVGAGGQGTEDEEEDDWDDDGFDVETEDNTLANAEASLIPDEKGEMPLSDLDQDLPRDLGEGPNVIIPPPEPFPVVRHNTSNASSSSSPYHALETVSGRPEFGRDRCTLRIVQGDPEAALERKGGRQRRYVVASDLSEESGYAVEWAIGTVARDGDEVWVVNVHEDESKVDPKEGHGQHNTQDRAEKIKIQRERQTLVQMLARQVNALLQRTHLHITVICQAVHTKNARHMLLDLIDFLDPTLAIVGSRGLGKLKGTILGSMSHYLVQKSSAPVMIARRRLKRHLKRTDPALLRQSVRVPLAKAAIEKTTGGKEENDVIDAADIEAEEDDKGHSEQDREVAAMDKHY